MRIVVISAWLIVALASIVLTGCGAGVATAGDQVVVATTPVLADLARNVAPRGTRVISILPLNADPHVHEIRPSDVSALASATLVVRAGREVDQWVVGAIRASGTRARVIVLQDRLSPRDGEPHWWLDPSRARQAAGVIARALRTRAAPYQHRIDVLDGAVRACLGDLSSRTLVTSHDAFGGFARHYGLRVVGAVIPARTTRAQASARQLARLVATIRREGVPAVFPEASVNVDVAQAVARDAGAQIGGRLYADTLGPAGSSGDTYLKMIASDASAIAIALGGRKCSLPS